MQELLFPHITYDPRDTFDEYAVIRYGEVRTGLCVCLFEMVDTNAKRYYLVADREMLTGGRYDGHWLLSNAREFGHAENRAHRYFDMRREELDDE